MQNSRALTTPEPVPPPAMRFAGTGDAVLILEDEQQVSAAVQRLLTTFGYETGVAATAGEALGELARRRFDLLLCDVRLPDSSGVEFVQAALARFPDLAIVMLSGLDDALTATRAMQAGALDYLTKPVERDALAHALQRALRVSEQRRVARVAQRRKQTAAEPSPAPEGSPGVSAVASEIRSEGDEGRSSIAALPMPPQGTATGIPLLLVPPRPRSRRSWPRRVVTRLLRI